MICTLTSPLELTKALTAAQANAIIFHGDCIDAIDALPDECIDIIFSSPPYSLGKPYEISDQLHTFRDLHLTLLPKLTRILRPGGSLCWQVGNHIKKGICTPLDAVIIGLMANIPDMHLRNRVIWEISHGLNATKRLSGRHETILWYTKGDQYHFDLDAIRVAQKYPGKAHYRGALKGQPSGNPLGKNPGDVWYVPNIRANHVEKTEHPCQFPVALPQRFIRALAKEGSLILDPFMGSASTGVAALLENYKFIGCESFDDYIPIAINRLTSTLEGTVRVRPWNQPVQQPNPNTKVAQRPKHFPPMASCESYIA